MAIWMLLHSIKTYSNVVFIDVINWNKSEIKYN